MPGHFAFQTQSVKVYFFQTMSTGTFTIQTPSVKASGIWTTHSTADTFRMISTRVYFFETMSVRVFACWTQHTKVYLPTGDYTSTCWTMLVSTYAAHDTR